MKSRKRDSCDYEVMRHERAILKAATEEEQRRAIENFIVGDLLKLDADFETWAHQNQLPPNCEGWRTWLMMAGRGFGKTRAGAEWIHRLANGRAGVHVALIGATIADARSIMVEGVSGLLSIARRHRRRLNWEPSLGRLKWPNGSVAHLFSGDSPDGLRGPEHDFAWADELAKWRLADEAWDNLQFSLRRGSRPRALVTTTPRPGSLLERIQTGQWTVTTNGKTSDNINLDEKTIEVLTATYGGTRLGQQELDGELLKEIEGALWTREMIESALGAAPRRVRSYNRGCRSARRCDGEVRCVRDRRRGVAGQCPVRARGCVGAGAFARGLGEPRRRCRCRWDTDLVVAEANNGGAMVESVLKAADFGLKVRLVHASRGKCVRAEPIALKFEMGKAFFAGIFRELEAELSGMIAGGGYEGPGRSPDRADAMVWAMTALTEARIGVPRVRRL